MRLIILVYSDKDQKPVRGIRIRDMHPEESDQVAIDWAENIVKRVRPNGAVLAEVIECITAFEVDFHYDKVVLHGEGARRNIHQIKLGDA